MGMQLFKISTYIITSEPILLLFEGTVPEEEED
jgi:hypothetical protein